MRIVITGTNIVDIPLSLLILDFQDSRGYLGTLGPPHLWSRSECMDSIRSLLHAPRPRTHSTRRCVNPCAEEGLETGFARRRSRLYRSTAFAQDRESGLELGDTSAHVKVIRKTVYHLCNYTERHNNERGGSLGRLASTTLERTGLLKRTLALTEHAITPKGCRPAHQQLPRASGIYRTGNYCRRVTVPALRACAASPPVTVVNPKLVRLHPGEP